MYRLLLIQFLRSRTTQMALVVALLTGVVSIFIGKQFLDSQEAIISNVTQHQREHIERNVNLHDDMGLLLYYLRFSLIDRPDKLAALSIGQRDINPGIQSITIRTLEAQKYDTDLNNPAALHTGNLDLGFVIIYLFPLVIITMMFDLLSAETERGTWQLVIVQSGSPARFLLQKMLAPVSLIYGVLSILFTVAIIVLGLPAGTALAAFIISAVLYLAFWFVLCFWIATLQRSSSFNALTLLSVWILLAILVPASVNNYVVNRYPVPEALDAMVKQRDGYHEKWDIDRQVTMERFYTQYPQFKHHGVPKETSSWLWYYAMQQMGDDESREQSLAMQQKIGLREKASRTAAWAVPTMHAQLLFNDIARTGLRDHLHLVNSTNAFHERLRLHFYPGIFDGRPAKDEDWKSFRPEYLLPRDHVDWRKALVPLLIIMTIISVPVYINTRKLKAI